MKKMLMMIALFLALGACVHRGHGGFDGGHGGGWHEGGPGWHR